MFIRNEGLLVLQQNADQQWPTFFKKVSLSHYLEKIIKNNICVPLLFNTLKIINEEKRCLEADYEFRSRKVFFKI